MSRPKKVVEETKVETVPVPLAVNVENVSVEKAPVVEVNVPATVHPKRLEYRGKIVSHITDKLVNGRLYKEFTIPGESIILSVSDFEKDVTPEK